MDLERFALLINRLSEKSKTGAVKWVVDASNSFKTVLGEYVLSISIQGDDDGDPYSDPDYYLAIYKKDKGMGAWIDSVGDEELKDVLPGSFKIMQHLFRDARRSANGVDNIVEDLIKEIDGKQ